MTMLECQYANPNEPPRQLSAVSVYGDPKHYEYDKNSPQTTYIENSDVEELETDTSGDLEYPQR